jgi:hypothetical protein
MTALVVFLALTSLVGLAVTLGWTPDSRDREWSVGRLLDDAAEPQTTGWQGRSR